MWNTVLLVPSGLHWSHRNWRPGEVNFGTERPRQGMKNDEKTTKNDEPGDPLENSFKGHGKWVMYYNVYLVCLLQMVIFLFANC